MLNMTMLLLGMTALDAECALLKCIRIQYLGVWELSHRNCIYVDQADERIVLQSTYAHLHDGQTLDMRKTDQ